MVDVLQGVATVVGALGTIFLGYLAYRLRVMENRVLGRQDELRQENLELGERLTALMEEGSK